MLSTTQFALVLLAVALQTSCASNAASGPGAPTSFRIPPEPDSARAVIAEVRTLAQAIEVCHEHNPSLAEAAARVGAAEAGLRQARAALWPTAGANLAVTWADAPSVYLVKTIDAHALAPNTDFNDPGSLENTELGLAASWNLWRGGRDARAIDAAKFGVQADVAAESAQRNALTGMVVGAWLDHRAARELQASDDARIRTLEEQLADAHARVDSGSALEVDVLALEVRLAQAREARTRSELGARLAIAAMRELLALGPGEVLEPNLDAPDAPQAATSCEAAEERARAQRAELTAARAALDAARERVRAEQGAWSPRLDLEGRVWGDDDDIGLDFENPNSAIALSLSFDAFDGGARSAGIDTARAGLIAAHARLRSIELAVTHDVERAWIGLESARSRLVVVEQAVRAAERGAELVGKQLAGGSATTSRYLDAEADLAQARAEHVLARIEVQRASFDLLRATGALENMSW